MSKKVSKGYIFNHCGAVRPERIVEKAFELIRGHWRRCEQDFGGVVEAALLLHD